MATSAIREDRQDCESRTTSKSASTSGSASSSTDEEERLRRLFLTCDRDGDGFIDSQDLAVMCRQLNMEDAVEEIMVQLGADDSGRISFDEFLHCRMRLITEIEQERLKERGLVGLPHWSSGSAAQGGGARPETLDLDTNSLYRLMEEHDPEALQRMVDTSDTLQGQQGGSNFLDVANSLHLAALTSLKGEILELGNRLQHVTTEKEVLEKQLNKYQSEKLRAARDAEQRLETTTSRYEERITELHSVIAELRKKIDRNHINVIREEEEFEAESDGKSEEKSNADSASVNENNANESRSESVADLANDLNVELSRVVCELESALERQTLPLGVRDGSAHEARTADCLQQTSERGADADSGRDENSTPPVPPRTTELHRMEAELLALRDGHSDLHGQVARQETELNKLRAQMGSVREERDRLKRKVRELQTRLQSVEASSSPNSRTSTPTKSPAVNPTTGERTVSMSSTEQTVTPPVAKIAGMRKLKTGSTDRLVHGAEISQMGLPNAKVAELLVQSVQDSSNIQEISQSLTQSGNRVSDSKIKDFEVELERLTSKIDHLKSQNDLLVLTLEESKAHCDRLTVLMGKYESNNTALQLAISFSDQALEAYEVLVALLDSEQGVLLANCRAAGLGSNLGNGKFGDVSDQEETAAILQKAHLARKGAEHSAKQIVHRLERSLSGVPVPGCATSPWEELSSNSHTTSTTSSTGSSSDTEFSKLDERKLRDAVQQLKNDRAAVKMTVLELESVHIDPLAPADAAGVNPDTQKLDLENAVLMQELMAMKEEKAELKSQNYLLEKEKAALDLQLSGKQSQEHAYVVQIDHLKSELYEQEQQQQRSAKPGLKEEERGDDSCTPAITLAELRSQDSSQIAQDLAESLKREKKLKARVQELMVSLEKISKNADIRHQQSAEFVNDLKRANCALISAFEKSKKKYQGKMKKMEAQLHSVVERYEAQIHALQHEVLSLQKEVSRRPTNETSL